MIKLVLKSAHVAILLLEAVTAKQAMPLPNQLMVAFVATKLLELLIIFYFNNALYTIEINELFIENACNVHACQAEPGGVLPKQQR